eukprot:SAG31_NODE_1563_length_7869_cov_6.990734_9_plen_184_part_00
MYGFRPNLNETWSNFLNVYLQPGFAFPHRYSLIRETMFFFEHTVPLLSCDCSLHLFSIQRARDLNPAARSKIKKEVVEDAFVIFGSSSIRHPRRNSTENLFIFHIAFFRSFHLSSQQYIRPRGDTDVNILSLFLVFFVFCSRLSFLEERKKRKEGIPVTLCLPYHKKRSLMYCWRHSLLLKES